MSQQSDQQIVSNQSNKADKKIANAQSKMDKELTGDEAVDSVITTPQSQWSPYQIAVANLNPELKSRNKRYQSALNSRNILENEKVNLWQAGELMMNSYREAIQNTNDAANRMMNANSANAAIQAWWAISGSAGLSTNPAAAAATRIAAQNQAAIQNAQIRSNTDQNIANIYNSAANVPSTLSSIASNQAQIDANAAQAQANANLANAQANYYNRQATSTWTRASTNTNTKTTTQWWEEEWINLNDYTYTPNSDGSGIAKIYDKEWKLVTDENVINAIMDYYNSL